MRARTVPCHVTAFLVDESKTSGEFFSTGPNFWGARMTQGRNRSMSQLDVAGSKTAQKLAAIAGNLYTLPAVALKVLELVERPDVDAAILRECIEKDPALATKILKVVNSSLYGPAQPIGDLGQALAFLGAKPLKLLVLGFSLPPKLFHGLEARVLAYYWRRSLTKAVAARELSEHLRHRSSDECFLAGLLQDLGLLVFIQALGSPFQRFVEKVLEQREDLYRRERDVFGFDHRDVSAALLRHWGMPTSIADALISQAASTSPVMAEIRTRRTILEVAESAAMLLAEGRSDVWPTWQLGVESLGDGQTVVKPDDLLRQIHMKVLQLGEVLSLRLPAGESVEKILARAHNALAREAEAVAGVLLRPVGTSAAEPRTRSMEDDELERTLNLYIERAPENAACVSEKNATIATSVKRWTSGPDHRKLSETHRGFRLESQEGLEKHDVISPGSDPGLLGTLRNAVTWCRTNRCGLSLVLVDYLELSDLVVHLGPGVLDTLQNVLSKACQALEHPGSVTWPYGDAGCAWILPDCERELAVTYAHEVMRQLRSVFAASWNVPVRLRVGVSYVATPAPNFPPEDLLVAAQRCLFGSGACGGGVVKSIEIY